MAAPQPLSHAQTLSFSFKGACVVCATASVFDATAFASSFLFRVENTRTLPSGTFRMCGRGMDMLQVHEGKERGKHEDRRFEPTADLLS